MYEHHQQQRREADHWTHLESNFESTQSVAGGSCQGVLGRESLVGEQPSYPGAVRRASGTYMLVKDRLQHTSGIPDED